MTWWISLHSDTLHTLTLPFPQAASDAIIKNLQQENNKITTAWYDLSSRLQSNHVVLQRRHDVPKSWLNKQRQMINGNTRHTDMKLPAISTLTSTATLATPRR